MKWLPKQHRHETAREVFTALVYSVFFLVFLWVGLGLAVLFEGIR